MAKITKEDIEVAHKLIRAKDLDGLCNWIDLYKVRINKAEFREIFRKSFLMNDDNRAIKLFDAAKFEGTDPEVENLVIKGIGYAGCSILLIILLGCLGGVAYLFSLFF